MRTVIRRWQSSTGEDLGHHLLLWCPGCEQAGWGGLHQIGYQGDGATPEPVWSWNGDRERPTVTPSLLVTRNEDEKCHSYITDGSWVYQADSTHALAGQTVPLPDLPDWVTQEADDSSGEPEPQESRP